MCCDSCQSWFHIQCQGMGSHIYECMNNSISWHCLQCGVPNFSTALFDSWAIPTSNTYSELSTPGTYSSLDMLGPLDESNTSPGPPQAESSPKNPDRGKKAKGGPKIKRPLRIVNVNCQSLNNKRGNFQNMVNSTRPDVLVATETWLSKDTKDGEIGDPMEFSSNFDIQTRPGRDRGRCHDCGEQSPSQYQSRRTRDGL